MATKKTKTTTRFVCQLTGGENDLCTHAWFDLAPAQLKAELARLKGQYDTLVAQADEPEEYHQLTGHNFNLNCGTANYDSNLGVDVNTLEAWETLVIDPQDPGEWESSIDDYALRATDEGVYFIVESSWDEDADLDKSPVLPWDYIQ